MKTDTKKLKARMEGAKAALEGRKIDANTYDESDDLHFEWLAAWTDAHMERIKAREQKSRCRKCWGDGQVEIQSGPYYRTCDACGGSGQNK